MKDLCNYCGCPIEGSIKVITEEGFIMHKQCAERYERSKSFKNKTILWMVLAVILTVIYFIQIF